MYVKFDGIPSTIGQGKIAENVVFNDHVWVAQMRTLPEGAVEITFEEFQNITETVLAETPEPEPEIESPVQSIDERLLEIENRLNALEGQR